MTYSYKSSSYSSNKSKAEVLETVVLVVYILYYKWKSCNRTLTEVNESASKSTRIVFIYYNVTTQESNDWLDVLLLLFVKVEPTNQTKNTIFASEF